MPCAAQQTTQFALYVCRGLFVGIGLMGKIRFFSSQGGGGRGVSSMNLDPSTIAWLLYISEWLIRLTMMVLIPSQRSPDAAKAWLLLVFFEPWLGLVLYLVIGRPRMPRWRRRQLAKLPAILSHISERCHLAAKMPRPELGPEVADAVHMAENLGQLPIVDGNSVEIMTDYDGIIQRLAADIDAAENHVHLLFYIFADDSPALGLWSR